MERSLDRRQFLRALTAAGTAAVAAGTSGSAEDAADKAKQEGGDSMLKVAMLSGWHVHARGYAQTLAGMPGVKVTAVWDEDPKRGAAWAQELGVPFEKSLDAVLRRDDVAAVAVNAPTNRHAEVMVAAARAGKHIFTEKVMAPTVKECDEIAQAVRGANVKFCISFPHRTRPEYLYAHKAVQDGLLGTLTFLRARVAHNGASAGWLPPHFYDPVTCGGGAMMDLGAHPMYLARWLGGRPVRIASTFTSLTGHEVEDNAVSTIEFENKAIGVAETSFVSTNSPDTLELSGSEGSLVAGAPGERRVLIRSNKLDPGKWVAPPELPAALPSPLELWVNGIVRGGPIPFGLEEGIQLTELMQYAYLAYRERRQVEIPPR